MELLGLDGDSKQALYPLNDAPLKRSAERSQQRKSDPYRSAMSMLTFFMNRAGRNLPARRRQIRERAKDELRLEDARPVDALSATAR